MAFSHVFTSCGKVWSIFREAYPDGRQTAQPKDEKADPVPGVCSIPFWHAIWNGLPAAPNASYHEVNAGS